MFPSHRCISVNRQLARSFPMLVSFYVICYDCESLTVTILISVCRTSKSSIGNRFQTALRARHRQPSGGSWLWFVGVLQLVTKIL